MQSWHSIDLGDPRFEHQVVRRLKMAWFSAHAAAGSNWGFAIFKSLPPENSLYFPPSTLSLALEFGAKPCLEPAKAMLTLYQGDVRSWDVIFP